MAFPNKKIPPMMPPPGEGKKPRVMIAIGVGPKKPGEAGADHPEPDGDEDTSGKMSADKALSVKADQHCRNCQNYVPESGECQKVQGYWDPEDACWVNFEPMSDGDGDEMGGEGAGDNDGDEQPEYAQK